MAILTLGFGLALSGFIVHLALSKLTRTRASGRTLILLFVCTVCGGAVLLAIAQWLGLAIGGWCPATPGAWVQGTVLGLVLSAAYVMTYPAVDVASPTLTMVDAVTRTGAAGMARDEMYLRLDDKILVLPRVADLVREGLARESDARILLTPRGARLATVFRLWQQVLGAGKGG
jgi:hypothetical protein